MVTLGAHISFHPAAAKREFMRPGAWQALCYGCRRTNSAGQESQLPSKDKALLLDDFFCGSSQGKMFLLTKQQEATTGKEERGRSLDCGLTHYIPL